MMKIAMAQIAPVVGAFDANIAKIKEAYERACSSQARLLITPELSVCGYPPCDLMDRQEMLARNEAALEQLKKLTLGKSCALLVGHIGKNPALTGKSTRNQVSILENGKVVFEQAKSLLPTYDVFDEARYWEPATEHQVWVCDGFRIGIAICEDLWGQLKVSDRRRYSQDPLDFFRQQKVNLLISASSSPYEMSKLRVREGLHQDIARSLKAPLIYVNQVGATDEILFDGGSFAVDAEGTSCGRLPLFRRSFGKVTVKEAGSLFFETETPEDSESDLPHDLEVLRRGLVTGIQEYFQRTGFKKAILGLSGGIDSALVAALAVQALGSKNVVGVAMPSQYSSSHSLEDAEILAKNLGISLLCKPIKFLFSMAAREISGGAELSPIALENLQSRLRGNILMTLSNHTSSLVLTTGNKSELAMGYCTLYGDMCGALAPIGDLYKTQVYELARYLNQTASNPIPERTLTRAPSAELRPNQTDQDSLPPYDLLDALLRGYLEEGRSLVELEKSYAGESGFQKHSVRDVLRKVEINEYKRRQSPPILKVSTKAFGMGRRVPIAKAWDL